MKRLAFWLLLLFSALSLLHAGASAGKTYKVRQERQGFLSGDRPFHRSEFVS